MRVPPGQLRELLGIARVGYVPGPGALAITDTALAK
jgi:hypothetical protein